MGLPKKIVCYDLHKAGQDYATLIQEIKSYPSWARLQGSVWILRTEDDCVKIRDRLAKHIDQNDKLFVADLDGLWATQGHSKEVTDWLNS